MVSGPTRTWPCSINFTAWRVGEDGGEGRRKGTHGADGLCHLGHGHEDGETAATKGSDGELVLDVAEFGCGVEDAHVVELAEELALHPGAEGVLGGEEGDAVCKGSEGAAELVVLVVVVAVLDVVPAHDLDFAEICILFPLGLLARD